MTRVAPPPPLTIIFAQNPIGLTTKARAPDNQPLDYVYDPTHRLTDVKLNGASITPAMQAKAEYQDTRAKGKLEQFKVLAREGIEAVIPSASAQVPVPGLIPGLGPVPVTPGHSMPGQLEFVPATGMMKMQLLSETDGASAARTAAEKLAEMCECRPDGGYDKPTFTPKTFAHVLFGSHLSERFIDQGHFSSAEKVSQALVDEIIARGNVVSLQSEARVVYGATLTRPLGAVGYARSVTNVGTFKAANKVRLVYEKSNCTKKFWPGKEVVAMYPIE